MSRSVFRSDDGIIRDTRGVRRFKCSSVDECGTFGGDRMTGPISLIKFNKSSGIFVSVPNGGSGDDVVVVVVADVDVDDVVVVLLVLVFLLLPVVVVRWR